MENNKNNSTTVKSTGRGGKRAGAGRKKGGKNKLNLSTTQTIVDLIYDKTGLEYAELFVDDFLRSRDVDKALAHKYHLLLSSKIMPTLSAVAVENDDNTVDQRMMAFAHALKTISGTEQITNTDDNDDNDDNEE